MIKNCSKCADFQNRLPRQPLKPTETPELPFEEVASDLFEFEGNHYVLLVDYYSKFIEVDKLKGLHCSAVVESPQSSIQQTRNPYHSSNGQRSAIFRRGILRTFAEAMESHTKHCHPHTPHSNGEAERAVQTVKKLWCKATDKHLALLDYRTTPIESVGLSPA